MLSLIPKIENKIVYKVVGDAEHLPFREECLDVITFNSVLHHLPSYLCALKEAKLILKKGGNLFVSHEPNRKYFESSIRCLNFRVFTFIKSSFRRKKKDKKGRLFKQDLIDFHSPTSTGKINSLKGLDLTLIKKIFASSDLVYFEMYSYGGFRAHSPLLRFLEKVYKILFRTGYLFRFLIKKN